jgi:hypothetical protein
LPGVVKLHRRLHPVAQHRAEPPAAVHGRAKDDGHPPLRRLRGAGDLPPVAPLQRLAPQKGEEGGQERQQHEQRAAAAQAAAARALLPPPPSRGVRASLLVVHGADYSQRRRPAHRGDHRALTKKAGAPGDAPARAAWPATAAAEMKGSGSDLGAALLLALDDAQQGHAVLVLLFVTGHVGQLGAVERRQQRLDLFDGEAIVAGMGMRLMRASISRTTVTRLSLPSS